MRAVKTAIADQAIPRDADGDQTGRPGPSEPLTIECGCHGQEGRAPWRWTTLTKGADASTAYSTSDRDVRVVGRHTEFARGSGCLSRCGTVIEASLFSVRQAA